MGSSIYCVDLAWNEPNVLCCTIKCMHDMYIVYIESGPPVLLVYLYYFLILVITILLYSIDVKNKDRNSPLDVAVREKKQQVALFLFNHSSGSDEDKDKVLMQACESGELNAVKKLVEQHNVNPRGEISFSGFAVESSQLKSCDCLL